MQTPPAGAPPSATDDNLKLKLCVSIIDDWDDFQPQNVDTTWGELLALLATVIFHGKLSRSAFQAASRSVQYREKNGQGWMPCRMRHAGFREPQGVMEITLLIFETPPGMTLKQIQQNFADLEYVVHSTYDHTPEIPQYRVILPFAKPIDPHRLPALFDYANRRAGGVLNASHGHQWWRFFYLPSCPPDAVSDHVYVHHPGRLLDADELGC